MSLLQLMMAIVIPPDQIGFGTILWSVKAAAKNIPKVLENTWNEHGNCKNLERSINNRITEKKSM